jgi:hypothetical protein
MKRIKDDPRVEAERKEPGEGWCSFELHSPDDIRVALKWLSEAYESARP